MSEIKRLKTLLPTELRFQVILVRAKKANPALISTVKTGNKQFAVQIDLKRWHQLKFDQRDLLFWHEIARIKNKTVNQLRQDLIVLVLGFCVLLIELLVPNLLLLPVTLVVVGLAVNQIYQRYLGEQSLREATAADQKAIALAIRFGYSFSTAYSSLYDALKMRSRRPIGVLRRNKRIPAHCQVRLQALEICARSHDLQQCPSVPEIAVTNSRDVIFAPAALSFEHLS